MNNTTTDPEPKTGKLTHYEKTQNFNSVTRWLHSFRYRKIVQIFEQLTKELNRPIRVFEIGAASGKLYSVLNEQFDIVYSGVELKEDRVQVANERYGNNDNFSIVSGMAEDHIGSANQFDVVVALETMEHIPENNVVRIVEKIAESRPGMFVCSVPVEVGPIIWIKNVGSMLMGYHARYKNYKWSETFWSGLYRLDKVRTHELAHRGFDWRWLAQTIRYNMNDMEVFSLPFNLLPVALSPTVMFVAKGDK